VALLGVVWAILLAVVLAASWWSGTGDLGEDQTRGTVRVALLYYGVAVGLMLFLGPADWQACGRIGRLTRCAWTLGWLTYLIHVAAALHYYDHWSHAEAMERTARQGGFSYGIYVSHLFTLLWTSDVAWWWMSASTYGSRRPTIGGTLHAFMLFIIFNGTVVYETGLIRWAGAAGLAVLGALAMVRLRRARQLHSSNSCSRRPCNSPPQTALQGPCDSSSTAH
jgi:hypothetical protein